MQVDHWKFLTFDVQWIAVARRVSTSGVEKTISRHYGSIFSSSRNPLCAQSVPREASA
jgi:hypothetical protein